MRQKLKRYLKIVICLFLSACATETPLPLAHNELPDDLAELKNELDQMIFNSVKTNHQPFNWNDVDHATLYNALMVSDQVLAVGYEEGQRNALLEIIYLSEEKSVADIGHLDDILIYKDDVLQFFGIKINNLETIEKIRAFTGTSYVEASDYPMDIEHFVNEQTQSPLPVISEDPSARREMILDPMSEIDYPDQVAAFDGGLRTIIRRHNIEDVYLEHELFGDGIDVAIIDNGVLRERLDFFLDNGYGERIRDGYYNPWWFLPFVPADGWQPRPTDVFGLSILIYDTYYIHGSEMIKQVLTLAPNSNIHSVRGSTWTVILFIDQIMGICNAIKAQADDPDIKISSMSMGTIFHFNRIASAIEYYHTKDKLIVVSAGSTFPATAEALGVLFPGQLTETITTTAIVNRESTGGEFELTESVHGGPENDFCVESTNSSSVATSRMSGMISLVWSANPDLSRDEVFDILVEASYFYQNGGIKDPLFGWGTVDIGMAVELALD